MVLTAEQHLKIATVYEKAAGDWLGVPPQQRMAFARKAKLFRMRARIMARKDAAVALKTTRPPEARPETASKQEWPHCEACAPKAKYPTLAEQLERARASARAEFAEADAPKEKAPVVRCQLNQGQS
jgi:hypothetical protein